MITSTTGRIFGILLLVLLLGSLLPVTFAQRQNRPPRPPKKKIIAPAALPAGKDIRNERDQEFARNQHKGFLAFNNEVREAVERGLEYLASTQQSNGSWVDKVGYKVNYDVQGVRAPHVAATSLAGIAFLAQGSTPNCGKYGKQVKGALDYILNHVTSTGYITEWEQKEFSSRMYGHAFCTLFLAEAYGTTRPGDYSDHEKVGRLLRKAVDCIVKSQHKDGGWRYTPGALDDDADISVTVSQVIALRAARNCGISVPRSTINNAIKFVKKCYSPGRGFFEYQSLQQGFSRTTFALTAAGTVALQGAGEYFTNEVRSGISFLILKQPEHSIHNPNGGGDVTFQTRFHYFYGHYYAVQAFYWMGGAAWKNYFTDTREQLLSIQREAGNWNDFIGPNYATAMACMVLQMPNGYLPIAQR